MKAIVTGKQKHILSVMPFMALLILLAGSRATGQMQFDTIVLDEVSIIHQEPLHKAGMLSSSMDSLSMVQMQGRSLSELLGLRSSLHIKSTGRGALSTASFRGTDASHTKVFWNGISMNSPMTGQVDFSLIPVIVLDELSLLYGSSSLSEGSGAFGGAIMLENKAEWKEGTSVGLNQELASFGSFSSSAHLATGSRKVRSETSLYHNRSANDYLFYNTDIIPREYRRLENAAYHQSGILQEIYYRPSHANSLALNVWYQDAFRELPPVMSYEGTGREESQGDRNLRSSLEWSRYTSSLQLKFRSAIMVSALDYDLNQLDFNYIQYKTRSLEKSMMNRFQGDIIPWKKTKLRFRLDVNRQDARISDHIQDMGYHHRRQEASLLTGIYQQAGEDLMVYSLLRVDRADHKWLPIMPSVGFRYRLTEGGSLTMKGSVCRNYNLPSLNDLYWIPGGNPGLRPEKGVNADLGFTLEHKAGMMNLKAATNVFAARVRDWIVWRPTWFRYWEAENLAMVYSRGFESQLFVELDWNRFLWTLKGNYAFTRSTNESVTSANDLSRGGQLVYIPVHTANMHINVARQGYYTGASLAYTGRRYTQPSNEVSDFRVDLNPYFLSDIYMGKDFSLGRNDMGIRLAIYNLLNVSYQAILSRPMPLRNYALTFRWKI